MARITTIGISIQRIPFSETSQVVHFLTPDLGRVVCIAKGAYRDKNAFQGPLDLLVSSEITLTRRRGAAALLNRRRLLHHYPGIRRDPAAFARACLVGELLRRGLEEGQGGRGLFLRTTAALELLDAGGAEAGDLGVLAFQAALLRLLGYGPVLDRCVECGARPGPGHRLAAYPASGGVVCRRCPARGAERVELSWEGAQWILEAAAAEPGGAAYPSPLPPEARGDLWAFFRCFFQYFLEKRIHSYAFIMALERFFRAARRPEG